MLRGPGVGENGARLPADSVELISERERETAYGDPFQGGLH